MRRAPRTFWQWLWYGYEPYGPFEGCNFIERHIIGSRVNWLAWLHPAYRRGWRL